MSHDKRRGGVAQARNPRRGIAVVELREVACGDDWQVADLGPVQGQYAWRKWSVGWNARPGEHILRCRAWDAEGNVQPLDPVWDLAGFANNQVQRVEVFVPEMS